MRQFSCQLLFQPQPLKWSGHLRIVIFKQKGLRCLLFCGDGSIVMPIRKHHGKVEENYYFNTTPRENLRLTVFF